MNRIVQCKACHARIFFVQTAKSERMPVDAQPSPKGNLAVTPATTRDELPTAVVLTLGQAVGMRAAGRATYISHFAGCPQAGEFRKRALAKRGGRR